MFVGRSDRDTPTARRSFMTARGSSQTLLIILAFIAFVSLGLPDGLLGVGWPSMRAEFARPLSQLGLLLAAGTTGYLSSSFLAGQLVRAVGVGRVLLGSSLLVTTALLGNALAPAWPWLVLCALLGGLGGGAIDAGINTFAAARFSPRVVNWLHAFWGVGASAGPLLMTAILASQHSWRLGYGMVAGVLALLSVLFGATLGMWRMEVPAGHAAGGASTASMAQSLAQPMVWMQLVLFLLYAGLETTAGQLFYSLFTETRKIDAEIAGVTVGGYWAALTVGRLLFGQMAATLGDRAILRTGMVMAPLAATLLAWNPTPGLGLAGAVLFGLALAPIFPTLIAVTPQRVGHFHAAQSVGFQVAAASVGTVTFPSLVGVLARSSGLEVLGRYLIVGGVVLLATHEVAMWLAARASPLTARAPISETALPQGDRLR
jgi:fucose permease